MLPATVISDLIKGIREGRSKGTYGAKVSPDTVFSTAAELSDIATRASQGGQLTPIAQKHTWSMVVPDTALPTRVTEIAHYRFDETSGSTATDASYNGNDLTVSGAVWAEGKFGNCLSFDGTDDFASDTATSQEPLKNYLYIAVWVNPTSVTGNRPIVALADRFVVYIDAGVLKVGLIDDGNTTTINSGLNIATDSWQHIAFQFDNGNVLLGIDGLVHRETIALTTYTEEFPVEGLSLTVGKNESSFFAGKLDDLVIDANMRVQDDAPSAFYMMSLNDALFWPFMENSGQFVHDTKMLGTTLMLTGGTWTNGRIRYGVSFDGVDDYGEANPTAESFVNQTLSVEVIIKFLSTATCPILTQASGINLSIDSAGNIVAALGGVSNPATVLGNLTVVPDEWYILTVVYDGSQKELWVNGQKIGQVSATGTATLSSSPLYLCRSGSVYGHCVVDRVRIYRGKLMPYYRSISYFQPGEEGFSPERDWRTV